MERKEERTKERKKRKEKKPRVQCFCLISSSFLKLLRTEAEVIYVTGADTEHSPGNVSGLSFL